MGRYYKQQGKTKYEQQKYLIKYMWLYIVEFPSTNFEDIVIEARFYIFKNIFTNTISLISVTTIDSKTMKLSINSFFYWNNLQKLHAHEIKKLTLHLFCWRYKEEENRLNWMHCQNRHQEWNTFGNFQICAQMFQTYCWHCALP